MLLHRSQEEVEAANETSNGFHNKLFLYPWIYINVFLIFSLVAYNIRRELCIWSQNYRALSEDKKRNVVTYIIQFLVTSAAFALQVYGSSDILFRLKDVPSSKQVDCMLIAIFITVTLYVWEVCYREKLGVAFLTHHTLTLVLLQCAVASFNDTENVLYLRYAMLFGFQATTEQLTFLALFCFRLGIWDQYHSWMFYTAGFQAFFLKTSAAVTAFVFFIQDSYVENRFEDDSTNWDVFWKVFFIPLFFTLYSCQLYTCYILSSLGLRRKRKSNRTTSESDDPLNATGHLSVWCVDETIYTMGRRWVRHFEDAERTDLSSVDEERGEEEKEGEEYQ